MAALSHDLEPTGAEARALLDAVAARVLAHLDSLPVQPAQDLHGADALARTLAEDLPETGTPLPELLDLLFDRAIPKSLNTAGPGYLAYIPGGGLFPSALADLIADTANRYTGIWSTAPALVQLELNVLRWFARMVGLPPTSGGILTSGGSLANFTAIVAARTDRLPEAFLHGALYTSTQTHHSVSKAALLAGFPARQVRAIPTDDAQRIDLQALRASIAEDRAAGLAPFMVVANAGTTNTGAVDDLEAVAELTAREGLWMHVDGAYGGFFALTERGRTLLKGLERADSITLDPHKGLGLPYGTGCLLVRDPAQLRRAHHASADYLQEMQEDTAMVDFSEISPELTRPYRGLRAWLPLKLFGADAFRRHLDEKLDLARLATAALSAMPGVVVEAEPQLSVLAFRLVKPGLDGEALDALNRRFLQGINALQRIYLSPTVLRGAFVLRIALLSFRTHEDRLREGLEDIRTVAKLLLERPVQG